MYHVSLPTTTPINFTTLLLPSPTSIHSHSHGQLLTKATISRAKFTSILRRTSRAERQLRSNGGGVDGLGGKKKKKAMAAEEMGDKRGKEKDERDYNGVVKAAMDYIPNILALQQLLKSGDLILKNKPVFRWRSTLAASSLMKTSKKTPLVGLSCDLRLTLHTLHLSLTHLSSLTLSLLGSYELIPHLTEQERKQKDAKVNECVEWLGRAGGGWKWLAEEEGTLQEGWNGIEGMSDGGGMLEMKKEVLMALSKISLSLSSSLAIRRLLSQSVSTSHLTITPGPPLPKGHPSPSLLAKMNVGCYEGYDEARGLIKTFSGAGISGGGRNDGEEGDEDGGEDEAEKKKNKFGAKFKSFGRKKDKDKEVESTNTSPSLSNSVSPSVASRNLLSSPSTTTISMAIDPTFRRHISLSRLFFLCIAYKWLGLDAGETPSPQAPSSTSSTPPRKKKSRTGEAIAWLRMAREGLKELMNQSSSSLGGGGGVIVAAGFGGGMKKGLREKVKEELEGVEIYLGAYEKVNDTVTFEPIPSSSSLLPIVPSAVYATKLKPFTLPSPITVPTTSTTTPSASPRFLGSPSSALSSSSSSTSIPTLKRKEGNDEIKQLGNRMGEQLDLESDSDDEEEDEDGDSDVDGDGGQRGLRMPGGGIDYF